MGIISRDRPGTDRGLQYRKARSSTGFGSGPILDTRAPGWSVAAVGGLIFSGLFGMSGVTAMPTSRASSSR